MRRSSALRLRLLFPTLAGVAGLWSGCQTSSSDPVAQGPDASDQRPKRRTRTRGESVEEHYETDLEWSKRWPDMSGSIFHRLDRVSEAYSAAPDRLYLIDREGRVAFKSGRGPFGFKTVELEQALVLLLLSEGP